MSTTNPIDTVLVGIGGYGGVHGNILLDNSVPNLHFAAIVDPYAKKAHLYDRFKDTVPVYNRLEDFFAAGGSAELTIISTPIHLHCGQSITALEGGSHVLCEKPLVPTLQELDRLDEKIIGTGKTLSVGFQGCYTSVIQTLKARILNGEFGKPLCFKTLICWPRGWDYYSRSNWAGRIKSDDGHIVNDSVTSNATAHHTQNMLFLLGDTMETSAELSNTCVETYRANDIESFDTCIYRGEAGGAKVFYAASHAVNYLINPVVHYELENAVIMMNNFNPDGACTIHHRDGRIEELTPTEGNQNINLIKCVADAIRNEGPFICTARTVRPITMLIDGIFNQATMYDFPADVVVKDSVHGRTYAKFLHLQLVDCFNSGKLPSEMGLAWAKDPVLLTMR